MQSKINVTGECLYIIAEEKHTCKKKKLYNGLCEHHTCYNGAEQIPYRNGFVRLKHLMVENAIS